MDFELSSDQEALRDGVRALCEGRFSIEFIRTLIDGPYVDRDGGSDIANTGVFRCVAREQRWGAGIARGRGVREWVERWCRGRWSSFLAAGLIHGCNGERLSDW